MNFQTFHFSTLKHSPFTRTELLNPSYLFLITFCPIFCLSLSLVCVCLSANVSSSSNKPLVLFYSAILIFVWSSKFSFIFMQNTPFELVNIVLHIFSFFFIVAWGWLFVGGLFISHFVCLLVENKRIRRGRNFESQWISDFHSKKSLRDEPFAFIPQWLINIKSFICPAIANCFHSSKSANCQCERANKQEEVCRWLKQPTTQKSKYFFASSRAYYFSIFFNVVFGSRPTSLRTLRVCSAILASVVSAQYDCVCCVKSSHRLCWEGLQSATPHQPPRHLNSTL